MKINQSYFTKINECKITQQDCRSKYGRGEKLLWGIQVEEVWQRKGEINWKFKEKIIDFENEKLEYLNDRAKLAKLFDLGIIDSSGDPLLYHPDNDQDEMK